MKFCEAYSLSQWLPLWKGVSNTWIIKQFVWNTITLLSAVVDPLKRELLLGSKKRVKQRQILTI
jgi:hypothetical protein